jgi:hypothetical protein
MNDMLNIQDSTATQAVISIRTYPGKLESTRVSFIHSSIIFYPFLRLYYAWEESFGY